MISAVYKHGTHALESLVRLIYPASCGACSVPLELEDQYLCPHCSHQLTGLKYPFAETLLDTPFIYVDEAWGLFPYDSPIREILKKVKFLKQSWLLELFRSAVAETADLIKAERHYDIIIPVPMDFLGISRREFNQTEILASLASAAFKTPWNAQMLHKRRLTSSQHFLNREARSHNLQGSFKASSRVSGQSVLLMDDICTTGATAEEAARALKEQGAHRVDLFVIAKTEKQNL